jgi:hypothetical protein
MGFESYATHTKYLPIHFFLGSQQVLRLASLEFPPTSNVNNIKMNTQSIRFLALLRYRIGTNPLAPDRNWNKKEHFCSLQEKLE